MVSGGRETAVACAASWWNTLISRFRLLSITTSVAACVPRAGIVGAQVPVGAGLAFANKYRAAATGAKCVSV